MRKRSASAGSFKCFDSTHPSTCLSSHASNKERSNKERRAYAGWGVNPEGRKGPGRVFVVRKEGA